ncbi:uncharacterized protein PV06_04873 [Exophiala oligosperma]|uniref:Zn(2)-C6 fungal-type domain-containing protein n=1 Tax=Exophiala oligosperma TaxID=215243 RepID=A0A0D2E7L6_9EURO|nr:uncharacterized protein PV06_04873 [Exophiala oligosperma]KIW43809.1 hypothetical protein PV06_04873 [Exophiala oligosperma]
MSLSNIPTSQLPTRQASSGSLLPPPRQIRFVSTDGQPHTKRRRINAACLTCRRRKTRCSGERPQCKTCTENGHACSGYIDRAGQADGEKTDHDGEEEAPVANTAIQNLSEDVETPIYQRSSLGGQGDPQPQSSTTMTGLQADNGEVKSPGSSHTGNSVSSSRNRVPYFRYFGPTAIVPGFKQMVVQVKDHRQGPQSNSVDSPSSGQRLDSTPVLVRETAPIDIPFYDATDPEPNAPLITHLCETFFIYLGCNFPFLQRERFLKDLEDKKVDAILVDAVCAVAARFSSDTLLCQSNDPSIPLDSENNVRRPFRGLPFGQRAIAAVIDTFSCPTMAVTQACLLLAYEEFGLDHDSGLWMYLGTAIRMAQDLGIQKLDGLQLEGRIGPTPSTAKHGQEGKAEEQGRFEQQQALLRDLGQQDPVQMQDRKANEQERIDTFWAIFFLDRAISSGVGRPVSWRDKDIEISFPHRPDEAIIDGHPDPFPPMIKIVHMYGRVADVLNSIKEVSQVTPAVLKRLASMEKDLTGIYQRLSPKLHFNATNFQHYVKSGHGTNFVLLHFWFHTLIVLVHQPTLLHSFEGRIQQLFPDSRELSMSSAKTIADIIAFAELIDVRSFAGNPFTSQPMYVAACAFLAEATAHTSQPPSRTGSPPSSSHASRVKQEVNSQKNTSEQKAASARHTLLATAANQNYQRCYKGLKTLDSYWAGSRYILTALDGKSKGLMSPLLFTAEDVDGDMPSTEISFTTPGWRRTNSLTSSLGAYRTALRKHMALSPTMDLNQVIGWSLTGTANSPAPSFSFLYPNMGGENGQGAVSANNMGARANVIARHQQYAHQQNAQNRGQSSLNIQTSPNAHRTFPTMEQSTATASNRTASLPYDPVSTAEADLLLGLLSPYAGEASNGPIPGSGPRSNNALGSQRPPVTSANLEQQQQNFDGYNQDFNNMFVASQDVDMNGDALDFDFSSSDMIPWLEYLPQDVLNYFGDGQVEPEEFPKMK